MGLFNISTTIIYGLTGLLLYLAYDRFNKVKIQKELRKQNLQSELALLKNQINPHFLFNTLNNIDSLIKSNPDKASATLVELSDMMRYMIYDTNVEKVSLKQELVYIENYLDLQKMQFPNSKLVNYQVNGDTKGIEIPPMLFIPFIENAFKHCTDKNVDDAIRFSFHISDNKIIFKSENIADKAHLITKDKSSGVGLDIVKRRLEILYPNKHTLDIKEENNVYSIYLELNIK
jgi:LytS/YehU family sensor histidine kinase